MTAPKHLGIVTVKYVDLTQMACQSVSGAKQVLILWVESVKEKVCVLIKLISGKLYDSL